MAHVANKGADCVENNTAPQPIFKERDFFHILKNTAGREHILTELVTAF